MVGCSVGQQLHLMFEPTRQPHVLRPVQQQLVDLAGKLSGIGMIGLVAENDVEQVEGLFRLVGS